MIALYDQWRSINLVMRIFVGLVVGVVLATVLPGNGVVPMFGTIFVGLLKGVAPILVFVLIISALSKASGNIGSRFRTVITLYMLSTLLAAVIAVLASVMFPVSMRLANAVSNTPPSGIGQVIKTILSNMVANPVASLMSANYVGILCWAIIFGIGAKMLASEHTIAVISDIANIVSASVAAIIQLAPFGIMGLVYEAVCESGLAIFTEYGKLVLLLVGVMAFCVLLVNPLIGFLMLKRNPYGLLLRCLRESGVTAFFTRSSAANIPVNMNLCERLGLDKDFYSVCIPLGATINMDGAAITITVMTLAVANTLGIAYDIPSAILLSVMATIGACGASGVAGGSLLLIPMACSLFGISNDIAMQAVGVGFIIGVVQDSCETALNSSGDVFFAAVAEFYDQLKQGKSINM